jgi:hypothetical protein
MRKKWLRFRKDLSLNFQYLVVDAFDPRLSTSAMLVENLKAEKV